MVDFDLSALDAADESRFIAHTIGNVQWVWIYAGPGHPKTIEASNRRAKKKLREDHLKEQAVVNGKKWKAEEQSVDEATDDIVRIATERLIGWHLEDAETGEKISDAPSHGGKPLAFSEETARQYLRDPKRIGLLQKALEWLGDEESFSQRSATTSPLSPSGHSNSTATKKGAPAETA